MLYPDRFSNEPRKRRVYEEACDLIMVYGLPRTALQYKGVVSKIEMKQIWNTAVNDLSGKSVVDYVY